MNGFFITFEGIDGTGKSTQAEKLVQSLRKLNYDVHLFREPGGTEIGEQIRQVLLRTSNTDMTDMTELLLFSAARAQLIRTTIEPLLRSGAIVICDRFIDSTLAYQGYGRNIELTSIRALNQLSTNGLTPNRTFLFTIEPSVGARRVSQFRQDKQDRLDHEGLAFMDRVQAGYIQIAKQEESRIVVLDAGGQVDDIAAQIWQIVQEDLRA